MGHAPDVQFFRTAEGWWYTVLGHLDKSDLFKDFEEAQADYIAKGFVDNHDRQPEKEKSNG